MFRISDKKKSLFLQTTTCIIYIEQKGIYYVYIMSKKQKTRFPTDMTILLYTLFKGIAHNQITFDGFEHFRRKSRGVFEIFVRDLFDFSVERGKGGREHAG